MSETSREDLLMAWLNFLQRERHNNAVIMQSYYDTMITLNNNVSFLMSVYLENYNPSQTLTTTNIDRSPISPIPPLQRQRTTNNSRYYQDPVIRPPSFRNTRTQRHSRISAANRRQNNNTADRANRFTTSLRNRRRRFLRSFQPSSEEIRRVNTALNTSFNTPPILKFK